MQDARNPDGGAECESPATSSVSTDAASGGFPESGAEHPEIPAKDDQLAQSMTQTSLVLRNIPSTFASNFGGSWINPYCRKVCAVCGVAGISTSRTQT